MKRLAFLVLALSGCAMPSADQGQGQGSSSTPTFVFAPVLNFGAVTGGSKGADSTSTTAPTSAPAATSANEATQKADAKADVTATVPAGAGGLSLTPPDASGLKASLDNLAKSQAEMDAAMERIKKSAEALPKPKPEPKPGE